MDPTSQHTGRSGTPLPTFFAPSERSSLARVQQQAKIVDGSPLTDTLLNAGLDCMLILNSDRQIVAASRKFADLAGRTSVEELQGQRPGEALGCIHSACTEGGCGTSEFCAECGAVGAIMEGLSGRKSVQECRMTRVAAGSDQSLDLQVMATPLEFAGERYTLIALHDISHEKRRRALERIFFHDVINLAGGMEGILYNLKEVAPPELKSDVDLSYTTIREMIEEIISQRDISSAESGDLAVIASMTNSFRLLHQVARLYSNHRVASQKVIEVESDALSVDIRTDPNLLRRVLGNLVKNAAEACSDGDTVTLSCEAGGSKVAFIVHNPQVMPRDVQLQIFQRSFSTKGTGRGLGTYSVKLITEKFLKGLVTFSSSEGAGTNFKVILPLSIG